MDKWLTFDCYGTLVDWRTGMTEALRSVAGADADRLLAQYHQNEPGVQTEHPSWRYQDVLRESLRRASIECEVDLNDEQLRVLGDTLTSWPVFPDTFTTLSTLREQGYKMGILSNVDRELLLETIDGINVPIDLAITSSDIGSFKPGAPHFDIFQESTGTDRNSWIHVACSWFHDIVPSDRQGIKSVFINREESTDGPAPATAVLPDLINLPDTVRALFDEVE